MIQKYWKKIAAAMLLLAAFGSFLGDLNNFPSFLENFTANEKAISTKDYVLLSNPNIKSNLLGSNISLSVMVIGIWDETKLYKMNGIDTENKFFINHRATNYKSGDSPLGSTDIAYPSFPISIQAEDLNTLSELSKYQVVEVHGVVKEYSGVTGKGYYIEASKIEP